MHRIRFLDQDSAVLSQVESSVNDSGATTRPYTIVNPSQNQLKTTWTSLSNEEKEAYLPSVPRAEKISEWEKMQERKTMKFIHSYRSYNLKKGNAPDDASPPDDAFLKRGYRLVLPKLDELPLTEKP